MQNWYDLIVNKYLEFNNMIGKANLLVYQILFQIFLKNKQVVNNFIAYSTRWFGIVGNMVGIIFENV